jgi:hypothetical protein
VSLSKRDREFIDRLDGALTVIGRLRPKNPADIAAIFHNNKIATAAAKELTAAIGCFRARDDVELAEHLDSADAILAVES